MKRSSEAQAVPKPSPPPPINAKFADRLPAIMNGISEELLTIEPAVNRLTVHLQEFFDYLEFEINKLELDIERMKWGNQVDMVKLKEAESWLQKMQQLKT